MKKIKIILSLINKDSINKLKKYNYINDKFSFNILVSFRYLILINQNIELSKDLLNQTKEELVN